MEVDFSASLKIDSFLHTHRQPLRAIEPFNFNSADLNVVMPTQTDVSTARMQSSIQPIFSNQALLKKRLDEPLKMQHRLSK